MLQGRYDANKPDHLVQLVEECLQVNVMELDRQVLTAHVLLMHSILIKCWLGKRDRELS